ncbi:MAG: hypothetical protein EOO61_06080 [Hymenobacter sp.]|nr:MAG: hypothetical protein EOO61_06080 [Hymenobacter sp.]
MIENRLSFLKNIKILENAILGDDIISLKILILQGFDYDKIFGPEYNENLKEYTTNPKIISIISEFVENPVKFLLKNNVKDPNQNHRLILSRLLNNDKICKQVIIWLQKYKGDDKDNIYNMIKDHIGEDKIKKLEKEREDHKTKIIDSYKKLSDEGDDISIICCNIDELDEDDSLKIDIIDALKSIVTTKNQKEPLDDLRNRLSKENNPNIDFKSSAQIDNFLDEDELSSDIDYSEENQEEMSSDESDLDQEEHSFCEEHISDDTKRSKQIGSQNYVSMVENNKIQYTKSNNR